LEGLSHFWNQPFLTVSFVFFLPFPAPLVTDLVMVFYLVTFVLALVTLPSAFFVFVTVFFAISKLLEMNYRIGFNLSVRVVKSKGSNDGRFSQRPRNKISGMDREV
jgi:hypothetical protein